MVIWEQREKRREGRCVQEAEERVQDGRFIIPIRKIFKQKNKQHNTTPHTAAAVKTVPPTYHNKHNGKPT
jgi:hypothetical protein